MTVSIIDDHYRYQCETCGAKLVSLWAAATEAPVATETLDEALSRLEDTGMLEVLPTAKRTRKPRKVAPVEMAQEPVEAQVEPETQDESEAVHDAEGRYRGELHGDEPLSPEELPRPTDRVIEADIVRRRRRLPGRAGDP